MTKGNVTADTIGASAGIGTLCIIFADKLDPSNIWKDVFIFGAPTITLVTGWLWSAAKNQIFLVINDYNSKKTLEKAQRLIKDAQSRGADDSHVSQLNDIMNVLERQKMETYKDRAQITFE